MSDQTDTPVLPLTLSIPPVVSTVPTVIPPTFLALPAPAVYPALPAPKSVLALPAPATILLLASIERPALPAPHLRPLDAVRQTPGALAALFAELLYHIEYARGNWHFEEDTCTVTIGSRFNAHVFRVNPAAAKAGRRGVLYTQGVTITEPNGEETVIPALISGRMLVALARIASFRYHVSRRDGVPLAETAQTFVERTPGGPGWYLTGVSLIPLSGAVRFNWRRMRINQGRQQVTTFLDGVASTMSRVNFHAVGERMLKHTAIDDPALKTAISFINRGR